MAKQQGLGEATVDRIADFEHAPFTRPEKLALRLTETIAYDPNGLDPELGRALREEFSEAQIVELSFAIGMFLGLGRVVAAAGLTLEAERDGAADR